MRASPSSMYTEFGIWFRCGLVSAMVLIARAGQAQTQPNIIALPGISFSTLTGPNGASYLGHTEGTFAVTVTSGSWYQSLVYGDFAPSIFMGPVNAPVTGAIQITDGAGPFGFLGFSFSSNNGDSTYDLQGFSGATLQYHESGTLAGTFGPFGFTSLLTANPSVAVDGLVLQIIPGSGVTSVNIDKIALAPVPEPGSLGLGALGLALLALRRRI